MPVLTDFDKRIAEPPFSEPSYKARLVAATSVAEAVPLVHVSGKGMTFESLIDNPPHELPTSENVDYYTDDTRAAEDALGLPRSAYFYAGRAQPEFGNVSLAFGVDCESRHNGSATPFDTGGLMHRNRYISVRLDGAGETAARAQYGKDSVMPLDEWRDNFARVLAAYFDDDREYWRGRPARPDPEDLYTSNESWRAWTFEVRFTEGQSIHERTAWCADESLMNRLRQLQDEQETGPPGDPETALDEFLAGPEPLVPLGSPAFCYEMEHWVQEEVGL
jgi:hypothetical protein